MMGSTAPRPERIFTIEVRVPEIGDGEAGARAALASRLAGLAFAEKGSRVVFPGEWRETAVDERDRHCCLDESELIEGERYELVHAGDLEPGDQIYLMARRRTVTGKPWHPEEMRPELVRIPVSDRIGGRQAMGPPFEHDHLVPRLVSGQEGL
jgi:hypothetical protein